MADWVLVVLVGILVVRDFMDHQEKKLFRKIFEILEEIERILKTILAASLPRGGTITQIGDTGMPTDNSIQAGGSGVFQVTPTPAGSAVPKADVITFAASDPSVTIAASPDGDPTKAVVGVPAGSTLTSFQLACQFTGPDFPTPVNATPISVSVTQPVAPLPTGGTITQFS